MHIATHFFASWVLANSVKMERKDRVLATMAGVAPDLDGLGLVAELTTNNSATPLYWWSDYHHALGHNIFFGVLICLIVVIWGHKKITATFLAAVIFHFHLLCDLMGARGPDGFNWPIYYFYPLTRQMQYTWEGQWALNAWPNILFTMILLTITFYLAWRVKYSPLEIISKKADQRFVSVLENRFGSKQK